MAKRVGIVARNPTVLRGLASGLKDGGFRPVPIDDLAAWIPGAGGVGVTVMVRDEEMKKAVRLFCDEHPHVPLVGISPDPSVGALAELLRLGAFTALGEDHSSDQLVQALQSALDGLALLPVKIAREMAARVPPPADPAAWATQEEVAWLSFLANGVTVPEIARNAGYSEREMFRVLQRMYQRIGVGSRTEAIVWATKNGLI